MAPAVAFAPCTRAAAAAGSRRAAAAPGRAHWRELVPHRDDVKLDGIDAFAEALVLSERADGLERLHVLSYPESGTDRLLTMDDPAYSTWIAENLEFATDRFRFGYTSLVTPTTAYDETFTDARRTLINRLEQLEIPGPRKK